MTISPDAAVRPEALGRLLGDVTLREPGRQAFVVGDRTLTYAELERESAELSAGLMDLGVSRGDFVALFSPNVIEAYVSFFAVTRIGAVFVPLNPRLTSRELTAAMDRCRPRVLLTVPEWGGHDFTERIGDAIASSEARPRLVSLRGELAAADDTYARLLELGAGPSARERVEAAEVAVGRADPAIMQFTSGTTSQPKGALLSQAATCRMASELGDRFGITPEDRYFGCSPICHLGGMTFSMVAVISHGATFVTLPAFDAGEALRTMEAERCSVVHGIDTHLTLLTGHEAFDPTSLALRLVSVSALAETVQQVADAFGPDITTISQYGSTETGGAPTCGAHDDTVEKLRSTVGAPLPGVDLAIVDPGTEAELAIDEIGEIRVGGWSLMLGYLGQPDAFAELLDSRSRFRTGDLGFLDGDGYLHFTGRLKNMLRVGGENVSVEEIELVLKALPVVRDAVVVGVPDPRLGEVAFAFVVARDGATCDEEVLRAHCRSQLATFKVPRVFQLTAMGDVPLTASGKIDRRSLSSMAAESVAATRG